jgi:hypothetical protein
MHGVAGQLYLGKNSLIGRSVVCVVIKLRCINSRLVVGVKLYEREFVNDGG